MHQRAVAVELFQMAFGFTLYTVKDGVGSLHTSRLELGDGSLQFTANLLQLHL